MRQGTRSWNGRYRRGLADQNALSGKHPTYGIYEIWRDDRPAFEFDQRGAKVGGRTKLEAEYRASFVVTPGGETLFAGFHACRDLGLNETERQWPHAVGINPVGGQVRPRFSHFGPARKQTSREAAALASHAAVSSAAPTGLTSVARLTASDAPSRDGVASIRFAFSADAELSPSKTAPLSLTVPVET